MRDIYFAVVCCVHPRTGEARLGDLDFLGEARLGDLDFLGETRLARLGEARLARLDFIYNMKKIKMIIATLCAISLTMATVLATIKKSLCLEASSINPSIIRTIVQQFRQKYEKTCDETDGVILHVESIDHLENVISKDSRHVHVKVTATAKIFKPLKGIEIEFQPTLIIQKGVFGKMYGVINLFIPESYLKGWIFQGDHFVSGEGDVLGKESTVVAVITDTKFATTKYNCICSLKTII